MRRIFSDFKTTGGTLLFLCVLTAGFISCASQNAAAQAEEYYSIGMAYFELGKFAEAEMWFNRARATDKTMVASEYNLGRIAYETGRYEEAAGYFETILERDPDNVMALKAAAYVRLRNGNMEQAEATYNRVLELIPESADDGYNYALLLYGLEKYEACEEVLNRYPFALEEKPASILLLARAQKAGSKVEAVDSYDKWLLLTTNAGTAKNPQGLFEYGQVLEAAGHYARALEQYKAAVTAVTNDTEILTRAKFRFEEAKLLLTQDTENEEGITEFELAIEEGFSDIEAVEALLLDERVLEENKTVIQDVLSALITKQEEAAAKEAEEAAAESAVTDGES